LFVLDSLYEEDDEDGDEDTAATETPMFSLHAVARVHINT
jgi:hypothetical protein